MHSRRMESHILLIYIPKHNRKMMVQGQHECDMNYSHLTIMYRKTKLYNLGFFKISEKILELSIFFSITFYTNLNLY
jgi:hypothetical protein